MIALALLRHSELPLASSEGSGVTVVLTTLHAVIRWGKTGGKTGDCVDCQGGGAGGALSDLKSGSP